MKNTNYKYKYDKYVAKTNKLLADNAILNGGKMKSVSSNNVVNYEKNNRDLFLDKQTSRQISRVQPNTSENHDSVKRIVDDPSLDPDNTFVAEMDIFDAEGQWKNEVLNGGGKQNC